VKRITECQTTEWDETKKEGSLTTACVAEKPVSEGMLRTLCSPWAMTLTSGLFPPLSPRVASSSSHSQKSASNFSSHSWHMCPRSLKALN